MSLSVEGPHQGEIPWSFVHTNNCDKLFFNVALQATLSRGKYVEDVHVATTPGDGSHAQVINLRMGLVLQHPSTTTNILMVCLQKWNLSPGH